MDLKQFDNWVRQLNSNQQLKNLEVVKIDEFYHKYILTLHDGKQLECEVGESVDVYFARFDGYYFYADNGYTEPEKKTMLQHLYLALFALVNSQYYEKIYQLNGQILKKELFLEGQASKYNQFTAHKVGLKNRFLLLSPKVEKQVHRPQA